MGEISNEPFSSKKKSRYENYGKNAVVEDEQDKTQHKKQGNRNSVNPNFRDLRHEVNVRLLSKMLL